MSWLLRCRCSGLDCGACPHEFACLEQGSWRCIKLRLLREVMLDLGGWWAHKIKAEGDLRFRCSGDETT